MSSKLISFIKVLINVVIITLFILAIFIIFNFDRQNAELNQSNYKLSVTIDMQEDTIERLSQNNKNINSELTQLKGVNDDLRNENKLLGTQNQKLLVQIEELKDKVAQLENEVTQLKNEVIQLGNKIAQLEENNEKNEIVTPIYNDFKSYLPYDAITNQLSKQWQLQQQASTNENGIRCIDGIPMVAVGTGWGLSVGDIALITCDNGNSFKVMIGDIKDDLHTDAENKTTVASGCRCEFIVELDKLDPYIKSMGSLAVLEKYSGYVINIEKIS